MEAAAPPDDNADERAVDLAEFDRLRAEIDNRTQIGTTLVIAELTALGAGLSLSATFPDILLGLAAVSAFLGLVWFDNAAQVHKIAAYIVVSLRGRLTRRPARGDGDAGALGWEWFYRRLDRGGVAAAHALGFKDPEAEAHRFPTLPHLATTFNLLFTGTPVVLLVIYVANLLRGSPLTPGGVARAVSCALVVCVVRIAVRRARRYRDLVTGIDAAVQDVFRREAPAERP
ncbi:MAG: hypothetical protein M3321_02650 [Actinomycetota bacterium]|nr:hypothetical protein [Actinomycetota bacterium]